MTPIKTTALVMLLGVLTNACAPPELEPFEGTGAKKKSKVSASSADDDDEKDSTPAKSDTTPKVEAKSGDTSAPAKADPVIDVSFDGKKGQKFNGATVARVCSDRGAHHSNATFVDATSLQLVSVDYPDKVIAKIEGGDFEEMKKRMKDTGDLTVKVDPKLLPTAPYEFALIMGGDSRFGSPAACKTSLKPKALNERDVEEFPNSNTMMFNTKVAGTGCAIVGFLEAYWDEGKGAVVARASSQLLLAADNEGRAGFPKGDYLPSCDGHDSPLVLDLSGNGITLSTPIENVFDVDGDGSRDTSPWVVSEDTPFLVRDANDNGIVDGVAEMFGNRGTKNVVSNGFEALARFDDVEDGVIDRKDQVWSTLRLWFDRNHDGRTDPGELETLSSRGVRSISLGYVGVREQLRAAGQIQGSIQQRSGATMSDGTVVNVVDVWFQRRF